MIVQPDTIRMLSTLGFIMNHVGWYTITIIKLPLQLLIIIKNEEIVKINNKFTVRKKKSKFLDYKCKDWN